MIATATIGHIPKIELVPGDACPNHPALRPKNIRTC